MITGEQIEAGRKLSGWSQETLALDAGINQNAVMKFEKGSARTEGRTIAAMRLALHHAGVKFPEGEPPRLRSGGPSPRKA